jgi:hypothetical protein
MAKDDRTLAVIDALYDAALDETPWPVALRKLTDFDGQPSLRLLGVRRF